MTEAVFKEEFVNRISDKRKLTHNLSYQTVFKQLFTYRKFVKSDNLGRVVSFR
jgi:hypothetical protein